MEASTCCQKWNPLPARNANVPVCTHMAYTKSILLLLLLVFLLLGFGGWAKNFNTDRVCFFGCDAVGYYTVAKRLAKL